MTEAVSSSLQQPVHSDMAALLDALPEMTFDATTLPGVREMIVELAPTAPPPGVEVREYEIHAETGTTMRVLRGANETTEPLPCVYSMHGGGYIIGDRTMDDVKLADWVRDLGCIAVSVEYRLAPEHPYPAPLDDCYAGLAWVHEHASELGIDTARLGVAGLSAGGGLAAALSLLARDRGSLPVAFQLLDSPMLDDRQITPSSRDGNLVIWSRQSNRFGWQSYLGDLYGTDDIPDYAAPARATNLTGLPPAFVSVGSVDGFRDEDIDYAMRLNQAGVPTELHVYPGAPHGFSMFAGSALAEQAALDSARWLGSRFS